MKRLSERKIVSPHYKNYKVNKSPIREVIKQPPKVEVICTEQLNLDLPPGLNPCPPKVEVVITSSSIMEKKLKS